MTGEFFWFFALPTGAMVVLAAAAVVIAEIVAPTGECRPLPNPPRRRDADS